MPALVHHRRLALFRQDDFHGTTDTVISLLNLPSIVCPETPVTVYLAGVATS